MQKNKSEWPHPCCKKKLVFLLMQLGTCRFFVSILINIGSALVDCLGLVFDVPACRVVCNSLSLSLALPKVLQAVHKFCIVFVPENAICRRTSKFM